MAELHVDLVSPEREVWSGEATLVLARTLEGELGIMPGHAPLLGTLVADGVVRVRQGDDEVLVAAVHGGFLSVSENQVSILAELAELAEEVNVERARAELNDALSRGDQDEEAVAQAARARGRLRAAGQEV